MNPDIAELLEKARKFKVRLQSVKTRLAARDFAWYPYDTLSNLQHLNRLLTGKNRQLIGDGLVLDIGCADGDLAFFLESLGCSVHAIDNPASSHNEMLGLRALRQALVSQLEIHALDLDAQFVLPAERYKLVFFLGVLYHLKNPVYVLEAISRQAQYCVLSTRLSGESDRAIAYLVDEDELNADPSNYWMFSDAGLKRLLKRTNWSVCDYLVVGDERDQRAFCLARSRYALAHLQLLSGWHAAEPAGYRWTRKEFSVVADVPCPGKPAQLRLKFYVPASASFPLTVSVNAGGELGREIYAAAGVCTYAQTVRTSAQTVRIDCQLDKIIPPDDEDPRERGIIVSALDLVAQES